MPSPARSTLDRYLGYLRPLFSGVGHARPITSLVCGVALMAIAVLAYLSEKPPEPGLIVFLAVLGVGCLAGGVVMFRHVVRHGPIRTLAQEIESSPPPKAARMLRQSMWLIAVIFGAYSAWVAYDLTQLELGRVDRVQLWKPIADLYSSFGFWPAVLLMPGFGLLIIVSLARKLRALKEQQTGRI